MDELKAAAERLRRDDEGDPTLRGYTHVDMVSDALFVAKAWRREHPADDGDTVTREWAMSVGFAAYDGDPERLVIRSAENELYTTTSSRWVLGDSDSTEDMVYVPAPMTRGAVRRLCVALGIELKEPSPQEGK